jgi:hypothetical protein
MVFGAIEVFIDLDPAMPLGAKILLAQYYSWWLSRGKSVRGYEE